jgi:predicted lipoprotein
MDMKKIILFFCFSSLLLVLAQCKKKEKEEEPDPEVTFDKTGMLSNYGNNIIIPAYAEFKIVVDSLKLNSDAFMASPSLTTLDALQAGFFRAYAKYQWISTFEFGPGETELIRGNLNIFPCDTTEINTKISGGDFDFTTVAAIDAKGFPAIDFLLYGIQRDDNSTLAKFTTDAAAANRKTYLSALVNEIKTKADAVNSSWSASGGNYISAFKNSTGNDVGSSTGLLVNQLNQDLELLKNARIGIPLGKYSLGTLFPEKTEAFYSQRSLELAAEHLKNIENVYLGRTPQNVNGPGLDDYLIHIGAQYGAGTLDDAIKNKFSLAKSKLALIPGTLSDAVVNNTAIVDAAYVQLQQLVILLKVDMTSALGVSITYVDSDGD